MDVERDPSPTPLRVSPSARLRAIDSFQQRHRGLNFAVAVVKKYGDDEAGQLAALIAYWGFFSLFPLLLVFVTVLGFVLQGNESAQHSVVNSTLSQYPVIGPQLAHNVHSIRGSGLALAIGVVGSLLAGLGVTGAVQNAFSRVWHVPRKDRPNFLSARLQGLWQLAVLGTLVVISTIAAGYVTAQTPAGVLATVSAVLVALAANLLLFGLSFRLFTSADVAMRELWVGVVVGAILWQVLQHVGGIYVDHVVRHAKSTSGLFAFVLGLLVWLYLGSRIAVLAAEVNVVRAWRLWPRSLLPGELLDADRRALSSAAKAEQRVEGEQIDVSFERPDAE
jgi:YihY family inner membrane protein